MRSVVELSSKQKDVPKKKMDSQRKNKKNEERDERASRRNVVKEASEEVSLEDLVKETKEEEMSAKKPRLHLSESLGPSTSVRDIIFASFTKPITSEDSVEVSPKILPLVFKLTPFRRGR